MGWQENDMKPILQAILLAERVYDDTNGKKIICGTFNRVLMSREPTVQAHPLDGNKTIIQGGTDIGCPSVYVNLTDVVPEIDVALQFVDVSQNKVLLELPMKIHCNDRLGNVEFSVPLPRLGNIIKEPGTYSIDLVWNGEIIGSHRVVAEELTEQS